MPRTKIATAKFCVKLRKEHPQLKKYNISAILKDYHAFLLETVCTERDGIYLPGVGVHMFVGVFKQNSNRKFCKERLAHENCVIKNGWKHDIEKAYEHYNIHDRDGYEARVMYSVYRLRYINKSAKFWGFVPSAVSRAACTKAFKEDWKKFIFIPNTRYIAAVYRKESGKARVANRVTYIEKNKKHNEFIFDDDEVNIEQQ